MRRPEHGRSGADRRVGQPDTVGRLAIANSCLSLAAARKREPGDRAIEPDRVSLYRLRDVLEVLSAEFAEGQVEFPLNLIEHLARNADSAAIGNTFEPGSDINPVPKNVRASANDVAKIDANAKFHALVRRYLRISSEDAALNFDRTSNRVHDAAKFGENAVACGVSDVAAVPLDPRSQSSLR